jgi:hypothetical protein
MAKGIISMGMAISYTLTCRPKSLLVLRSKLIAVCVLWLLTGFPVLLQAQYRKHEKQILWPADSLFEPDSLTLVQNTLRFPGDTAIRFSYDFRKNKVKLTYFPHRRDSLRLEFYTFPFDAGKPVFRYNPLQYDSLLGFADYPGRRLVSIGEKREELFPLPGIQKSGVISRGISLGNGQNGFVNSAMNLQLEGMLSKDIRLTALLSDQSLPFQPQGNTQQIRDLDRIFIRLEHKKADLLAGDVQLRNQENSAFFRVYRNLQGAEINLHADSLGKSRTRLAGGVAKGKFATVVVAVKEGVQGPYRLRPPDNPEYLFVILAGSERVWFDGRLLKRGFNQDYVIDYNSGEITLNNQLLITRFTRLRCDFEYSERNYSRSSFLAEHEEEIGKLKLRLGHYQEQDNPNRPLGFTLDSASLSVLQQAGDDSRKALLTSATVVPPEQQLAGNLFYEKLDTTIGGQQLSFYRLAAPGSAVLYLPGFTETLPGLGEYRLLNGFGNGKAFEYAGPGGGNYILGRQAVLPDKKSMTRSGAALNLGAHQLDAEAVFSVNDVNRYARSGDGDNGGNAQRIGWNWQSKPAGRESLSSKSQVSLTRLSRHFRGIDRFRDIEFERNWNGRSGDTLAADDLMLESAFQTGKDGKWQLAAVSNWRKKGDNVQGFQQNLEWQQRLGPFNLQNNGFLMRNETPAEKAAWQRLSSGISLDRWKWIPSWRFMLDENEIRNAGGKVLGSAMHYRAHSLGLRSRDSGLTRISASYTYREDKVLKDGEMRPGLFSQNAEWNLGISPGGDHQLDLLGNYRQLHLTGLDRNEENLSARLDYRGSFGDGALRQELVMTANTGQEARRSFQFIRINAVGEGTHQWIDYNGNGLQELDEFVEAKRPEDRQYIKIFIPTQDFITAYTRSLNYRLTLGAPASWQNKGRMLKMLSRFVLLSSLAEDRKITEGTVAERYLPFFGREEADEVLSAAQSLRHTLFFNRNRPDFGAEAGLVQSQNKTLLSNGFAWRKVLEQRLLMRKNLGQEINLSVQYLQFDRRLQSDALAGQNYRLLGWEAGPEISWQPAVSQRISAQVQRTARASAGGEERAESWRAILEYRGGEAGKRSINAVFRFSDIRFSGKQQTQASYELLEGLLPGKNYTWTLNIQQKLAQGLQLLLSYDGRKSGAQRMIHLGKVQANLLF